jgi:hypothetical protein
MSAFTIRPQTLLYVFRVQFYVHNAIWSLVWLISLSPAYHTMTLYRIFTFESARNDLQNIKYPAVKISPLCYSIRPETVLSVFRSQNSTLTMPQKLLLMISLSPAYHTMTLRIFTTEPPRNDLQNIKYPAVKISSLCYSIRPQTVLSLFRSQNSTFTMP